MAGFPSDQSDPFSWNQASRSISQASNDELNPQTFGMSLSTSNASDNGRSQLQGQYQIEAVSAESYAGQPAFTMTGDAFVSATPFSDYAFTRKPLCCFEPCYAFLTYVIYSLQHFADNLPLTERTRTMLDIDLNRQVRTAPQVNTNTPRNARPHYPEPVGNFEGLNIHGPQLRGHPVLADGGTYTGGHPGPSRAWYSEANRENYIHAYHDPTLPPQGRQRPDRVPNYPFSAATFVPADHEVEEDKSEPARIETMFYEDQNSGRYWPPR